VVRKLRQIQAWEEVLQPPLAKLDAFFEEMNEGFSHYPAPRFKRRRKPQETMQQNTETKGRTGRRLSHSRQLLGEH
jgi:hypothetical protein